MEAIKAQKSVGFIYAEKVTNGKGTSYFCVLIDVLWTYSSSTTQGTAGTCHSQPNSDLMNKLLHHFTSLT